MPLNELFLIIIGVILAMDVAVVASSARRDGRPWRLPAVADRWVRRPAAVRSPDAIPTLWPELDSQIVVDDGARTAAAIEAFVSSVDRNAGDGEPVTGRSSTARSRSADSRTGLPLSTTRPGRTAMDEGPPPVAADRGWDTWNRHLREETARIARFGRRATVVLADCPGLDGMAERLGAPASERVAAELARLLVAEGRASDRVAPLGAARFGVLLVETDEDAAQHYVERVRAASDDWLASAGLAARLVIGCASPAPGTDLALAVDTARERMAGPDARPTPVGRMSGSQPSGSVTEAPARI